MSQSNLFDHKHFDQGKTKPRSAVRWFNNVLLVVALFAGVLVYLTDDDWRALWSRETDKPIASEADPDDESDSDEADPDDPAALLPGLVVRLQGSDGNSHERIDSQIAFSWKNRRPDLRLPQGKFSARWRGRLLVYDRGTYRLSAYVAGKVKITLAGRLLLTGKSDSPQWVHGEPIELPFGRHPVEVHFEKTNDQATIKLYWQGPTFGIEPLPHSRLFHTRASPSVESYYRGRHLTRALRCAACHAIPGIGSDEKSSVLPAPALDRLAGHLSLDWIARRLSEKPEENRTNFNGRRMPHFGIQPDDAQAIARYLMSVSHDATNEEKKKQEPKKQDNRKPKKQKDKKPQVTGQELFLTLGCIACHKVGDLGDDGLFGGGDLSRVGQKRPHRFFSMWLADPKKINADHRMPIFDLNDQQRTKLATYLTSLGNPKRLPIEDISKVIVTDDNRKEISRGRKLVGKLNCRACHTIPNTDSEIKRPERTLSARSDWAHSCLKVANSATQRPGFGLISADRTAVRDFVIAVASANRKKPRQLAASAPPDGQFVLVERNCIGCHRRQSWTGIDAHLPKLAESHPELAEYLPSIRPPSLESAGDKFRDKLLRETIAGESPPHRREWLRVRMPRFNLTKIEQQALVDFFTQTDRVPDVRIPKKPTYDRQALRIAGRRLVTSTGFGCTSCHRVGKTAPLTAADGARGPDLSMLASRVRRSWFDRWVRDPIRIVPRMEMPSIKTPIRGVLAGDLDAQLAAVWEALNEPGFNPPSPGALRVARCRNIPKSGERAQLLTDVLHVGDRVLIKPALIGLPNRHNVLLDLQSGSLAGWWTGDIAGQYTEGKTWLWRRAGVDVIVPRDEGPEFTLINRNRRYQAERIGQFITELDLVRHLRFGIEISHRLHFISEKKPAQSHILRIKQNFSSLTDIARKSQNGFSRRIEVRGLPVGALLRLRLAPTSILSRTAEHDQVRIETAHGVATVRVIGAKEKHLKIEISGADSRRGFVTLRGDATGTARLRLDYLCDFPVDRFPVELPHAKPPKPVELGGVPGFKATRLGLTKEVMPTALSWRPDGTLIVASLEGRVWLAHDTDGDGLEDRIMPFSDDLPSPYGVHPHGDDIDVMCKFGLLRLSDADNDGHAESFEVVASGWGHTADYHDWAVGLALDKQNRYYIALPCQQDQRDKAAAYLRGRGVRLVPVEPTEDHPRRYSLEEICSGLRFPMGIAINRDGEVFTTDNQGNFNPFNELNHWRRGAFYGFINAVDRKKTVSPPLVPPAINIPHDWTRSVNGICFLETPAAVRRQIGHGLFGPFEGHLLGCEMDTRRLVRMSLQRVGDTYQGCVYPLSGAPPKDSPSLLGPICCAVGPDGSIYVGNLRDSGWGGGSNTGSVVRLQREGNLPPGIAEVRATKRGLKILFTTPMDARELAQTKNYSLSAYRRISTPIYGGTDKDRRFEKVTRLMIADDLKSVEILLERMTAGFVYELRVKNLSGPGKTLFPAEAFYTLRVVPEK